MVGISLIKRLSFVRLPDAEVGLGFESFLDGIIESGKEIEAGSIFDLADADEEFCGIFRAGDFLRNEESEGAETLFVFVDNDRETGLGNGDAVGDALGIVFGIHGTCDDPDFGKAFRIAADNSLFKIAPELAIEGGGLGDDVGHGKSFGLRFLSVEHGDGEVGGEVAAVVAGIGVEIGMNSGAGAGIGKKLVGTVGRGEGIGFERAVGDPGGIPPFLVVAGDETGVFENAERAGTFGETAEEVGAVAVVLGGVDGDADMERDPVGDEIENESRLDRDVAIFAEEIEDQESVMFDLGLPLAVLFLIHVISGAADDQDDEERGEEDAEAEPLETAENVVRFFSAATFRHVEEAWGNGRAGPDSFARFAEEVSARLVGSEFGNLADAFFPVSPLSFLGGS